MFSPIDMECPLYFTLKRTHGLPAEFNKAKPHSSG